MQKPNFAICHVSEVTHNMFQSTRLPFLEAGSHAHSLTRDSKNFISHNFLPHIILHERTHFGSHSHGKSYKRHLGKWLYSDICSHIC